MRKNKQVKEKKVTFDMEQWAEVERCAAAVEMQTGTYIKKITVSKQLTIITIMIYNKLLFSSVPRRQSVTELTRLHERQMKHIVFMPRISRCCEEE